MRIKPTLNPVDFFTSRGDITGYHGGDEPMFNAKTRRI